MKGFNLFVYISKRFCYLVLAAMISEHKIVSCKALKQAFIKQTRKQSNVFQLLMLLISWQITALMCRVQEMYFSITEKGPQQITILMTYETYR